MFEQIPLHPALVHAPLGIAALIPVVTVLVYIFFKKGLIAKRGLLLLALVHVFLVGASYAALETGENEEHTVEQVVGEKHIEAHEENAEKFMAATVVAFLISIGLGFIPSSLLRLGFGLLLCSQAAVLVLGYRVGHSGGELVYVHGAASAYSKEVKVDTAINESYGSGDRVDDDHDDHDDYDDYDDYDD